jgi:hypothetical protein
VAPQGNDEPLPVLYGARDRHVKRFRENFAPVRRGIFVTLR